MTLGDIISAYRKSHSLSMEKFGELAGMSKAYVSMLERNRTQRGDEPSPSIEMYRNVAKAMGMDVDELIRQVDGKISFSVEHTENKPTPVTESGPFENIVKLAGRDGSYMEKRVSDEQLALFQSMLDQMKPVDDDSI